MIVTRRCRDSLPRAAAIGRWTAAHTSPRETCAAVVGLRVARARPGNVPGPMVGVASVNLAASQRGNRSSRAMSIATAPASTTRHWPSAARCASPCAAYGSGTSSGS